MKFQVIYSRKIEGSVSAFTGVIFAFQYGLTRETVAENFSRTGIDWSEFILYVSVGLLLIFLFWNDDYILSTEGVTFRRVIFYKKHKWSEFPYSDRKFEERYNTIEYTPEVEAIFQIYHPQMPDPDWEFWKNELKNTKIWKEIDVNNYKRKILKYDIAQSVPFLPVVCAFKLLSNVLNAQSKKCSLLSPAKSITVPTGNLFRFPTVFLFSLKYSYSLFLSNCCIVEFNETSVYISSS